jgi:mandelate racemase
MHIGVPVLRSLRATAVELPMKRPLGTSAKTIDRACLLLIDILTQDGIEGHAYAFCYLPSIARSLVPIVAELGEQLADSPLLPVDLAHAVARQYWWMTNPLDFGPRRFERSHRRRLGFAISV